MTMIHPSTQVHPSATVENGASLSPGVRIWHNCQIRSGAILGPAVSVGKDSYIDANVSVGEGTRIQNHVNVYTGVHLGKWCFVGPAVVFTNDQFPRVGNKSWKIIDTYIDDGASIGAGAIIRCGIRVGAFAMIGAGALVTKNVAPFSLVIGHPASETKRICGCGQSVLALDCVRDDLIRDCCRENMSAVTLAIAIEESKKS